MGDLTVLCDFAYLNNTHFLGEAAYEAKIIQMNMCYVYNYIYNNCCISLIWHNQGGS